MIKITKLERDYLTKKCGDWYGENGISRTYNHFHHLYLCESEKNKKYLRQYYKEVGLDPKDVDRRCAGK